MQRFQLKEPKCDTREDWTTIRKKSVLGHKKLELGG